MSVREEIEAAIADYSRIFPVPYALAPNLELASRALGEATALIGNLVDPDPCDWDHNHSCQAHGYFYIPQGEKCPNQAGKDWVSET
jgi:hypothetical protein